MILNLILYGILFISTVQQHSLPPVLPAYFEGDASHETIILSAKLDEISGMAFSEDGRLFAHDDERGEIFNLDQKTGKILKRFYIGSKKGRKEDFEGLAIVGKYFYMVTSEGNIFQFLEGDDEENVDYIEIKTGLAEDLNVEGLCFDPATKTLLLACKDSEKKGIDQPRSVFGFSLENLTLIKTPRFVLSPAEIYDDQEESLSEKIGRFFLLIDEPGVTPSGLERHPVTGSFFILSSRGPLLIELSPDGEVIAKVKLDATRHNQPEGLVFTPDNYMIISDEAGDEHARLTIYRPDVKRFPSR